MVVVPPKINGQKGAFIQPEQGWGYTDTGYYWFANYEGTQAEVLALAAQYAGTGVQMETTGRAAGLQKLRLKFGFDGRSGPESPLDVWEIEPQDDHKDLLSADFPFGSIGDISLANKSVIKHALENSGASDSTDPNTGAYKPPAFVADGTQTAANSMYLLMRFGVDAFPQEATVIRHSQTVSNLYAVQASYINVNRILSTGSLSSLEGMPVLLLFSAPVSPTAIQQVETAGDLQYGWRKPRPRITRLSAIKWQVVNQYLFGLWPVKLYGQVL